MNADLETLFQEIGAEALEMAPYSNGKLLIYSEVESGIISCDLFYINESNVVRYRFASDLLEDLVYKLWENWQKSGNQEWRTLAFIIEDGQFVMDIKYPDQIDESEDVSDRRPNVLKTHFGELKVDYSDPE